MKEAEEAHGLEVCDPHKPFVPNGARKGRAGASKHHKRDCRSRVGEAMPRQEDEDTALTLPDAGAPGRRTCDRTTHLGRVRGAVARLWVYGALARKAAARSIGGMRTFVSGRWNTRYGQYQASGGALL
jgi:hypothetical protein